MHFIQRISSNSRTKDNLPGERALSSNFCEPLFIVDVHFCWPSSLHFLYAQTDQSRWLSFFMLGWLDCFLGNCICLIILSQYSVWNVKASVNILKLCWQVIGNRSVSFWSRFWDSRRKGRLVLMIVVLDLCGTIPSARYDKAIYIYRESSSPKRESADAYY